MTDQQDRFLTLDAMRGVAALLVAIGHWTAIGHVYLAVDFFLVLSGFILAHRYLYGSTTSWKEFVAARIARLYPLHLLSLLLFAAITAIRFRTLPDYADGTAWTFILHLLLLQNVGLSTSELSWNAPSWSISVEFWINLIFFALVTSKTSTRFLLVAAFGALAILAFFQSSLAVSLPNYFAFVNSGLLRGFASFLLGVVAYRIYRDTGSSFGRTTLRSMVLSFSLGLLLLSRPSLAWLDFVAPLLFSVCVFAFAIDHPAWQKWVRPLAYLGTISYSVYLLHYPIIYGVRYLRELAVGLKAQGWWVDVLFSPIGSFSFYLILVLLISHLVYHKFEVPSRTLVKRWLSPSRNQKRVSEALGQPSQN